MPICPAPRRLNPLYTNGVQNGEWPDLMACQLLTMFGTL
ncbi:unannotated protein [freshwater metagenome]|uniref:Unannotated protein n=1 Tax=freshwater metagenome TaxID=449393 RepID=A0A6J7F3N0_9ZZZZ